MDRLSEARGRARDAVNQRQTYARMSGLEWLSSKGRITERQRAAGWRYGWAYRQVEAGPGAAVAVPGGIPVAGGLEAAERHVLASAVLEAMRARLLLQPDLISACDEICGQEFTPREAAGEERAALRLEAVLHVALDILAMAPARRKAA